VAEHEQTRVGGRKLDVVEPGRVGEELGELAALGADREQGARQLRLVDAGEEVVLGRVFLRYFLFRVAGPGPAELGFVGIEGGDVGPEVRGKTNTSRVFLLSRWVANTLSLLW
jgi:hypothetical protein